MQVKIIRHAETTPIVWKNGMGVGRHIAAWPEANDSDDFDWQISTAEMTGTLPFSLYPGVDRSLCVTAGRLVVKSDSRLVDLSKESEPLAFPGEEEIVGTASDGVKMQDFNLLSRRGAVSHALDRWEVSLRGRNVTARDTLVVHVQEGTAAITYDGGGEQLGAGDTVVIYDMDNRTCRVDSDNQAICIVADIQHL